MCDISPFQYLSNAFTYSSKVTLPGKCLVKVTFPSHLQYLNGALSKGLSPVKIVFRAVLWPKMSFTLASCWVNIRIDSNGQFLPGDVCMAIHLGSYCTLVIPRTNRDLLLSNDESSHIELRNPKHNPTKSMEMKKRAK